MARHLVHKVGADTWKVTIFYTHQYRHREIQAQVQNWLCKAEILASIVFPTQPLSCYDFLNKVFLLWQIRLDYSIRLIHSLNVGLSLKSGLVGWYHTCEALFLLCLIFCNFPLSKIKLLPVRLFILQCIFLWDIPIWISQLEIFTFCDKNL